MFVMNLFRILADLIHLLSFFVLIWKIRKQRSCADLPWNIFHPSLFHLYLALMKIIYIGATAMIIYYIHIKYRSTYNADEDGLPLYFIFPPCFLLALVWNQEFSVFEVLWAFSIYLEAVSILPQLLMLQQTGNIETLTSHYIFCLGGYRFFYLLNWIYRFIMEDNYSQWIVWVSGAVQTILYIDFFYYYIKGQMRGESIALPTSTTV